MGTTIMCKNEPVLHFDLDEGIYEIKNDSLLPYQLRGRLRPIQELKGNSSKYEINEVARNIAHNNTTIERYFSQRVLPLTRENAKKIYNLFGYSQIQDDHSRALIALECRSVSLQDAYWVKDDREEKKWKEVDIRSNPLNEVVAQVSLHGDSLTLQGREAHTPELNGQGAYAKAWKREPSGLFLYKLGANGSDRESKIEVMVSKLLDKTNVSHVHYYDAESNGRYACKCKCMTTEDKSILPAMDYYSYCSVNGIDFKQSIMQIDADNIYKMWIVDYLTSNSDRHDMNWGFFYDTNTMNIIGCHPLFDHNNAFDEKLMQNKDAEYVFDKTMSMKEAAQFAMKKVDFHFTEAIKREDFVETDQYDSFRSRAEDLSLSIKYDIFSIPMDLREIHAEEKATIEREIRTELTPQALETPDLTIKHGRNRTR